MEIYPWLILKETRKDFLKYIFGIIQKSVQTCSSKYKGTSC